jgi:hypothetical protein
MSMSRIDTDVVTVGNISVYNVVANPNGVLQANQGSLAVCSDTSVVYQNTDGFTAWTVVSAASGGMLAGLKGLSDDFSAPSDTNILPPASPVTAVVKTLTFTAREDMTIKYLVFEPTIKSVLGLQLNVQTTDQNDAFLMFLAGMAVIGGGPDAGKTLIDGFGVPATLFAVNNVGVAPVLNIRLAAGDTLTIDVRSGLPSSQLSYNVRVLYEAGVDLAVKPKRFIAGPTPVGSLDPMLGASPAAGLITVNAAPLVIGDTIVLDSILGDNVYSSAGLTGTSPFGGTLTGAAVRTPGTNDFDATIGAITPLRDDIFAALQDTNNDWNNTATGPIWNFASVGGNAISVTRNSSGAFGNTDRFVTTSAGILLTPSGGVLVGGASAPGSFTMATPSVPTTIQRIAGGHYLPLTNLLAMIPSGVVCTLPPKFMEMRVNGAPAGIVPEVFTTDPTVPMVRGALSIPVLPGDVLDIDSYHSGPLFTAAWCLIGEET